MLTRYGLIIWGPATIVALALGALCAALGWWWGLVPIVLAWIAIAGFFRDPPRRIPRGLPEGAMLSPADGRITAILTVDEHEATGGPALIIRVFLSVLDVHVNRAPCDAEVIAVRHTLGRCLDARSEAAAALNESKLVTLRHRGERMGLRLLTGKIARRIVCPLEPGDRLVRGQRFGMIRFGSTAELILPRPADVQVRVRLGDRVRGGLTVLAELGVEGAGVSLETAEERAAQTAAGSIEQSRT